MDSEAYRSDRDDRTGVTTPGLWPTEMRLLTQRYRDVAPANLRVPTRYAFAAGKAATWHDRRAPRDLWDLWALSLVGAIKDEVHAVRKTFGEHGEQVGYQVIAFDLFRRNPELFRDGVAIIGSHCCAPANTSTRRSVADRRWEPASCSRRARSLKR